MEMRLVDDDERLPLGWCAERRAAVSIIRNAAMVAVARSRAGLDPAAASSGSATLASEEVAPRRGAKHKQDARVR